MKKNLSFLLLGLGFTAHAHTSTLASLAVTPLVQTQVSFEILSRFANETVLDEAPMCYEIGTMKRRVEELTTAYNTVLHQRLPRSLIDLDVVTIREIHEINSLSYYVRSMGNYCALTAARRVEIGSDTMKLYRDDFLSAIKEGLSLVSKFSETFPLAPSESN